MHTTTDSEPTPLFTGRFLSLVEKNTWQYAQRPNCDGVVAILALTTQRELVLVEQFRIPVNGHVIELPAGLSGDLGPEDKRAAAARELHEETGYHAPTLVPFGTPVCSSAGLTNERTQVYVAKNVQKTGEGGGVDGENITVHTVPIHILPLWLLQKQDEGKLIDPKIFMALAVFPNH